MGEAKVKRMVTPEGPRSPVVTVRLDGPAYAFTRANLTDAASGEVIARKTAAIRVTANLLQTAITAKYPAGLDGRDARVWARISLALQEEPEKVELLESDFEWVRRLFADDTLRLPAHLSHWRCALEDYLSDLRDELRRRQNGGGA